MNQSKKIVIGIAVVIFVSIFIGLSVISFDKTGTTDQITNIHNQTNNQYSSSLNDLVDFHSYKTNKDGIITVTNQSTCVPIKITTNTVKDETAFNMVKIDFPSTGTIGADGTTSFSSSNGISNIPFQIGTLKGLYKLAKNSMIINCGISYCKGANCNPDVELKTVNVSVFVNDTVGRCTSMEACRVSFSSTDMTISAPSPYMESEVPYKYKFYLFDSLGKYEEWFFGLEYKPQ
jgi:hypothetical protein